MLKIFKGILEFVMDILETVVFIGSMFIVIYLFVLTPNQVKGASMEPSFYTGDYILTSRITYKFRRLERGDVIVLQAPTNHDIEYIKRIIGLPGETITIKDNGDVYVGNLLLKENYISAATNLWDGGCVKANIPYHIPVTEVFVMGDNRPRSSDSREFCSISINTLIGQVFYRYFPANKLGIVTNPLPSSER